MKRSRKLTTATLVKGSADPVRMERMLGASSRTPSIHDPASSPCIGEVEPAAAFGGHALLRASALGERPHRFGWPG